MPEENVATENTQAEQTTATEQTGVQPNGEQKAEKTVEEIQKEQQAEIDRRVTEALKKQAEKFKKEQEEKERLAKLSEEERAKELEKQRIEEISKRERAIEEKELQIALRDTLVEEGLDVSLKEIFSVTKYVGTENKEDALKADIQAVKSYLDKVIEQKVESAKAEFLKGETPSGVKSDKVDTQPVQGNSLDMILSKLG